MKNMRLLPIVLAAALTVPSCASYGSYMKNGQYESAADQAEKEKDPAKRIAMYRGVLDARIREESWEYAFGIDRKLLAEYPSGSPESVQIIADMAALVSDKLPIGDILSIFKYQSSPFDQATKSDLIVLALERQLAEPKNTSGVKPASTGRDWVDSSLEKYADVLAWKDLLPGNADRIRQIRARDLEAWGDAFASKENYGMAVTFYTEAGSTEKLVGAKARYAEQKTVWDAARMAELEKQRPALLAAGDKAMTEGRFLDALASYSDAQDAAKKALAKEGAEKQLRELLGELDNNPFPSMWGSALGYADEQARSVAMTSARLGYYERYCARLAKIVETVKIVNEIPELKSYYSVPVANQLSMLAHSCWDTMDQGVEYGLKLSQDKRDIDYWADTCRFYRDRAVEYWESAADWYSTNDPKAAAIDRDNAERGRKKLINDK